MSNQSSTIEQALEQALTGSFNYPGYIFVMKDEGEGFTVEYGPACEEEDKEFKIDETRIAHIVCGGCVDGVCWLD